MGTEFRFDEFGTCQTASTLRAIAEEAFQAFEIAVVLDRMMAPAPQVTESQVTELDLLAIGQQEFECNQAMGVSHLVYSELATATPKSHPFFKRRGERKMLYSLMDWHSYRQTYDRETGDVTMLFKTMEEVSKIDTEGWSKSINQTKQDILDICDIHLDYGL
ncbi:MAG: hypothetical protein SGARI_005760 [Bacillariaceae sp.]